MRKAPTRLRLFNFSLRSVMLYCCLLASSVILTTCSKIEKEMKVSTGQADDILETTASVSGSIIDVGEGATQHGHCYGTTTGVTVAGSKTQLGKPVATGTFSSQLTGLLPNTQYYSKAYITDGKLIVYGEEISFTTNPEIFIPTVVTEQVTNITNNSATGGGTVTADGGAEVTARGIAYGTTQNPTISGSTVAAGTGTGEFTAEMSGLTPATPYYVRAYATNSAGTAYGDEVTFPTDLDISVPTVTTDATPMGVSTTSISILSEVLTTGGAAVTERGIFFGSSAEPESTGTKRQMGSGLGQYTITVDGLTPSTTYYYVAYAINSAGNGYGEQRQTTTLADPVPPSVTTATPANINHNSATVGGEVTIQGDSEVFERGVFYGTSAMPQNTGTKHTIGAGMGTFSGTLSGLQAGTKYYVIAFASNGQGISYGTELDFTTAQEPTPPVVTTTAASGITTTSATVGGEVTNEGNTTVSDRGIYWGTGTDPISTGTKLQIGSGSGTFSTNLTSLTPGTTYYVRAYATNSAGTTYGSQIQFTTSPEIILPTVTTSAITGITTTTASGGGNVTSDGNGTISARGVCWSTSENPTTANSKTEDGTGTGSFTSSLSGLTPGTTYYVRAYATNSAGTSYGQELSFVTAGGLTDYDGNTYETVELGNQIWMANNLKVTHYPNGSAIPFLTDNAAWANLGDNNTDDAYCYYNNDSNSEYGALYTYAAALNVCPTGWHLPSYAEWSELENYLAENGYNYDSSTGGSIDKIAKAMATSSGWSSSSVTGAVGNSDYPTKRNASGFSALPGGYRYYYNGTFSNAGEDGRWWSSTESTSSIYAYRRALNYNLTYVGLSHSDKSFGFSVRCIKDN